MILFFLSWLISQCSKQSPSISHSNTTNNPSIVKHSGDPIENAELVLRSDINDTKPIVDITSELFRIKKEDGESRYNQAQSLIKQLNDKRENIYTKINKDEAIAKWTYFSDEDSMSSKIMRTASINSSNSIDLSFPYSGTQYASLQLRNHPRYGKDVIFSIDKGQLLCSYNGCNVLVRFDEGSPIRFSANEPSDHSTTYLFIGNYAGFMKKMLKAKTVRIAVDFYQHGSQTFEFDVSGFDQNRYASSK